MHFCFTDWIETEATKMCKVDTQPNSTIISAHFLCIRGKTETCPESVGVSRGYTDYHQGRAIHMADSRIH